MVDVDREPWCPCVSSCRSTCWAGTPHASRKAAHGAGEFERDFALARGGGVGAGALHALRVPARSDGDGADDFFLVAGGAAAGPLP